MTHIGLFSLVALASLALTACDKSPPDTSAKPASTRTEALPSSTASTPASASIEKPTRGPVDVIVDATSAMVFDQRVAFDSPDAKGRIAAILSTKPIGGTDGNVVVMREARTPNVATVLSALASVKATNARVRTAKRDKSTAELTFGLARKPADCAAVGFIAKDSAVTAWPASGGTAARFSRGLAGPDLTRGSEGIRGLLAKCDAPAWFVGADESVTWGLVVDLVVAVASPEGQPPPRSREVVLLTKAPVPGRRVEAD